MAGNPENKGLGRTVAVGSGAGGTGKTLLAANLGVYLAQIGKKVILVDLNWISPALHTALGLSAPPMDLGRWLDSGSPDFKELLVPTSVPGLEFIAAPASFPPFFKHREDLKEKLSLMLGSLEADYLLLDLAPGIEPVALFHFAEASHAVIMTRPEPASVEQLYRFLSAAFLERLLKVEGLEPSDREEIHRLVPKRGPYLAPLDLVAELASNHRLKEKADHVRNLFTPCLVVNDTRLGTDPELAGEIVSVAGRSVGVRLLPLGHIEHDDTVPLASRKGRPFIIEQPGAKASKNIERIVRHLLMLESGEAPRPVPLLSENATYYDLLEIYPGASEDEIREAYRRLRDIYAPGSLAASGVLSTGQRDEIMRKVDEAYITLSDAIKRRRYDRTTFPEGFPASAGRPVPPVSAASPAKKESRLFPEAPRIDPDAEITGPLLREIREKMGVDIREVSQRTKINTNYLEAIEEENFEILPAPVYTRGFVYEIARYLRLDAQRAADDYLERLKEYLRRHHRLEE